MGLGGAGLGLLDVRFVDALLVDVFVSGAGEQNMVLETISATAMPLPQPLPPIPPTHQKGSECIRVLLVNKSTKSYFSEHMFTCLVIMFVVCAVVHGMNQLKECFFRTCSEGVY